jgi:hypothetical protein
MRKQPSPAKDDSTGDSGKQRRGGTAQLSGLAGRLAKIAESNGSIADPTIRDALMRLHSLGEIGRIEITNRLSKGEDVERLEFELHEA